MHDEPTLRPLAEPLRLAAIELDELAQLGDRLQGAIARLAPIAGPGDLEFLGDAQAADLLSQRLEGMAAFLRALASATPDGVMADVRHAVMDLTLAEQARRLSGVRACVAAAAPTSGELQLFGD